MCFLNCKTVLEGNIVLWREEWLIYIHEKLYFTLMSLSNRLRPAGLTAAVLWMSRNFMDLMWKSSRHLIMCTNRTTKRFNWPSLQYNRTFLEQCWYVDVNHWAVWQHQPSNKRLLDMRKEKMSLRGVELQSGDQISLERDKMSFYTLCKYQSCGYDWSDDCPP